MGFADYRVMRCWFRGLLALLFCSLAFADEGLLGHSVGHSESAPEAAGTARSKARVRPFRRIPAGTPATVNDEWVITMAKKLAKDRNNVGRIKAETFAVSLAWFKHYQQLGSIALPTPHIARSTKSRVRTASIKRHDRMLFINYDQDSDEPRLYTVDLKNGKILGAVKMGHGAGNEKDKIPDNSKLKAKNFSNTKKSELPSLGPYVSADTFTGENGLSMGMVGLQRGLNDNAYNRMMWLHEAHYVKGQNEVCGRTSGCVAVTRSDKKGLFNFLGRNVTGSTFIYAHASKPKLH